MELAEVAQNCFNDAVSLDLTCSSCTTHERVDGKDKPEAMVNAIAKGWKFRSERSICRKCF